MQAGSPRSSLGLLQAAGAAWVHGSHCRLALEEQHGVMLTAPALPSATRRPPTIPASTALTVEEALLLAARACKQLSMVRQHAKMSRPGSIPTRVAVAPITLASSAPAAIIHATARC